MMVFWYFYCLNSLEDCLVTSNHLRQRREAVKQRFLCCFVAVSDDPAGNLCHFARKRGFQRCESWCSSGTAVTVHSQNALNTGGFIVLASAGAQVLTENNTHPSRARRRSRSFDKDTAVSSCSFEQEIENNIQTICSRAYRLPFFVVILKFPRPHYEVRVFT